MRLIANSSAGVLIRDYGEHHVTVLAPPTPPETTFLETTFEDGVLLLADRVISLGRLNPLTLAESHIVPIWEVKPEVVIVGISDPRERLSASQRALFLQRRIGLEVMTLGAACRTYSVLVSDGRAAAALLFPKPRDKSD